MRVSNLLLVSICALVLTGCGKAGEAGGLSESCDDAVSAMRVSDLSELHPTKFADKFRRIAKQGDAETREVFNPIIKQLRNLAEDGKVDHSYVYPITDSLLRRCGLPVE